MENKKRDANDSQKADKILSYRKQVESELKEICSGILNILKDFLIPRVEDELEKEKEEPQSEIENVREDMVFFLKM